MDDEVTPDGCPVEIYLHLPAGGEPDLIGRTIPPGSRILELGCGTGRLANVLAARGHRVTGVDESPAMLGHLRGVTAVQARIQDLDLPETFDVVLLPSNLLSTVDAAVRRLFLDACARHLDPAGTLLAQWLPPGWFADLTRTGQRSGDLGPVRGHLRLVHSAGETLTAEAVYELGPRSWTQRFTAHRLTEDGLRDELAAAGLRLDRWTDDQHTWFRAVAGAAGVERELWSSRRR
ncbi:class I SAM-dependent methyltransferase [Actinoplanes siamensis]|uniref:class I SAM-dependent methyltransferase n=1 Tax=Actinoplanes siamensis TaxID=1223317 RepID=UPI001EF304A0|nr:class I SAM-dependent methyltransferase [Actinoplanes siamensis]